MDPANFGVGRKWIFFGGLLLWTGHPMYLSMCYCFISTSPALIFAQYWSLFFVAHAILLIHPFPPSSLAGRSSNYPLYLL
ncbi:hypothetical protein C8F04DRAFT_1070094, partial [Mycena alexandri]